MIIPSYLLQHLDQPSSRHQLGIILDDLIKKLRNLEETAWAEHVNITTIIGNLHDAATEGPGIDLVGQQVGLGGDTVLIYHSSGLPVSEYPATSAGIVSAFATAASGETILLPSITISVTAAVTLAPGASVIGISPASTLMFSGFGGAALTLGAGAIAANFSMSVNGSGQSTVTGIIALADDCKVFEVDCYVSGASTENICIGVGGAVKARELWAIILSPAVDNKIVWSTTFNFNSTNNDTVWNVLSPMPQQRPSDAMNWGMDLYGTELFVGYGTDIYRCTNLPAVRAAPATAATWEQILSSTTPVGVKTPYFVYNSYYWRDRFIVHLRATTGGTTMYYGEYKEGAWTWWALGFDGTAAIPITYNAYAAQTGVAIDHCVAKNPKTGATYWDLQNNFGQANMPPIWTNHHEPDATYNLYSVFKRPTYNTKIIKIGNDNLYDTGSVNVRARQVSGSYLGPHVYVTLEDGKAFISNDGDTYEQITSPGTDGHILDSYLAGGGTLVFMKHTAALSAVDVFRVSLDRGVTWHNKNGNLWSSGVIGVSLNGIVSYAWSLVF